MMRIVPLAIVVLGGLLLYWQTPATDTPPSAPAPSPPVPALPELTRRIAQRVDQAATQLPLEPPLQEQLDFAGNLTAWLISACGLTAEEERSAALAVHKEILATHKGRLKQPPEAIQKVFERLVRTMPPALRPEVFRFTLTILDRPDQAVFTSGAGHVYLTQGLLDQVHPENPRGAAMLSFFLARELGHIARDHCRRGYQLQKLQQEIDRGVALHLDHERLCALLQTSLAPVGQLVYFLYSRGQHYEADLFALQLCRNAGIDENRALDALRWVALEQYPALRKEGQPLPASALEPKALRSYLSGQPDPLRRLQRLQEERLGLVADPNLHGLFRYDRASGQLRRCEKGEITGKERPILFVHGMQGGPRSFSDFLTFLGEQQALQARPLLVFLYPGNGSLTRGGRFLQREIKRVLVDASTTTFICHSAGGLVFRFYAEKLGGAFSQAFLLATPQGGSHWIRLKFLLDAAEFITLLKRGFPEAISLTLSEGAGDIGHDLTPDSLFLRYLGQNRQLARRYHLYYGRCLTLSQALALKTGLALARTRLTTHCQGVESPFLARCYERLLKELVLPDEILAGDLIVSVASAQLPGAGSLTETRHNHQEIKADAEVMERIVARLIKQP